MSIPNVPTLKQKLKKGAEGAHEFARIMGLLYIAQSEELCYRYDQVNDYAGDYKGVDAIINRNDKNIGLQFAFLSDPKKQREKIKNGLHKAIRKFPKLNEWWIIIPEELDRHDQTWFDELRKTVGIEINWRGHFQIIELMLRFPHIGKNYYPEINYPLNVKNLYEPKEFEIDSFFNKFLESNSDVTKLLLNSQPTIADCRTLFSNLYSKELYSFYSFSYQEMSALKSQNYWNRLREFNKFEVKRISKRNLIEETASAPEIVKNAFFSLEAINKEIDFYIVMFNDSIMHKKGPSLPIWCYLNGRWVYFPEPWHVIKKIEDLRNDKSIKRAIRLAKWLGVNKEKVEQPTKDDIILINHVINELFYK